jgi:hypothetical protein
MAAAINANLVDIFSLSFGQCEQDLSTSDNAWYNNLYQQAAGQGIAVTVSTGDSGSAGCDGDAGSAVAARGLSVSGLASTPYNIAVGGTDFYALENSFSSYVSATLGSPASYYRTALGYIPESIWNDSTTADGSPLSANVPETGKYASIVAGSGGVSSCSSNYSVDAGNSIVAGLCISGYNKPSWQTGSGVPADGKRDLPDISLMSGNGYDGATWLVCDNDSNTLAFSTSKGTLNCSNIPGGYFDGFGGTSTAAPAFAGILALVQQKTGSRLGQAAQNLYQLYNGAYGSAIFHDVAVGNNSVPCTSGTTNCALNSAGHNFLTGYNALTGYDLASGLGSVDATQLVNHWGAGVVAGPTFTLAATTPTAIATPGGSTTSTISVTAVGGYTGSVTLACTLTTYPSGASFLPVCSIPPTAVAMGGSAIATVNTTAATAALSTPKLPGRGYFGASGGTLLALLIFFGIPARRRSWRSMLGMLMLLAALGGMTACGSGGSTGGGGGGGSTGTPGTTVGLYIFTVTGTGNPAVATSPTTTFSVTVN